MNFLFVKHALKMVDAYTKNKHSYIKHIITMIVYNKQKKRATIDRVQ